MTITSIGGYLHFPTPRVTPNGPGVRRALAFIVRFAAGRGHALSNDLWLASLRLAIPTPAPDDALRVIRRLRPLQKGSRRADGIEHFIGRALYLGATLLHDLPTRATDPRFRYSERAEHTEAAVASALWHAGYAEHDGQGSGRACRAAARALIAGTEIP